VARERVQAQGDVAASGAIDLTLYMSRMKIRELPEEKKNSCAMLCGSMTSKYISRE
jgi:hypothetical protein